MKKFILCNKFRILNFIILFPLAFYSFAYNLPNFIIFALANALLIQSVLLLCARLKIIYNIFAFFVSFVIAVDVVQVAAYSCRFNYGIIASIFETNKTEALSMFSTLYQYIPLYLFILVIVYISLIMLRREYVKIKRKAIYLYATIFISILIVSIKSYRYVHLTKDFTVTAKREFFNSPLLTLSDYYFHWTPSFFFTTSLCTGYLLEQYKFNQMITMEQDLPSSISHLDTTNIKLPNTIMIVIGESANREYFSLYGYDLNTTPNLDSIYAKNNLKYYKALSPASITRDAVPFLMTFGTINKPDIQFTQKGIIGLAKERGFETLWVSNQDKSGVNDSPIGYVAMKSDMTNFPSQRSSYRDDLDLVNKISKYYSNEKKQLIVIHLRGSHQAYKDGFDAIDVDQLASDSLEKLDYARTIHHTDRVLGLLYTKFFINNPKDKILFYLSDHGEIVNVGHGLVSSNMDQFKVPFIVVGSEYINQVDSIAQKYMNNGILNTVNFPFIFSEIIGYKIKDEAIKTAKEEGLYYKQVDGKILKFTTY